MPEIAHRTKLSQKQLTLLRLLAKFRYVTIPLLAQYIGVRKEPFNRTMKILVEHGYVTRIYNNSYKIERRPAIYFLSKEGIKYLREHTELDTDFLRPLYKNGTLSDSFIEHQLRLLTAIIHIRYAYDKAFSILTKIELRDKDEFTNEAVDAYLLKTLGTSRQQKDYILEVCDNPMLFISKKRLRQLIDFLSDEWVDENNNYPTLLFVLNDQRVEKTFLRYARKIIEDTVYIDVGVRTTTLQRVQDAELGKNIWMDIASDLLVALD